MNIHDIILRPILTEKATQLAGKQVYMFEVNKKSNKFQIEKALIKLYKVEISGTRVVTRKGKKRKVGKKMKPTQSSDQKIAYVTVSKGKIELFPQT